MHRFRSHTFRANSATGTTERDKDIASLVELVGNGTTEDQKKDAALALWSLARNNVANQKALARAGAIAPLIKLVEEGTEEQRGCAILTLMTLAEHDNIAVEIAEKGGIAPLVKLVEEGTEKQKTDAVNLLYDLSAGSPAAIADAGGIQPLVNLADSGSTLMQKKYASWALKNLREPQLGEPRSLPPPASFLDDGQLQPRKNPRPL